ncbi:MAG: hypothetical protein CMH60_07015 [Myxococcales bacterium]|nr:hypothetical protein [Myxococcales bacterium]
MHRLTPCYVVGQWGFLKNINVFLGYSSKPNGILRLLVMTLCGVNAIYIIVRSAVKDYLQ